MRLRSCSVNLAFVGLLAAAGLPASPHDRPASLPSAMLRQHNWESISMSMAGFGPLVIDGEQIQWRAVSASRYRIVSAADDGSILVKLVSEKPPLLGDTRYRFARLQLTDQDRHLLVSLYTEGEDTAGEGSLVGKYFRGPVMWPRIPKRGLAGWEQGANAVSAAWYYNWWISPAPGDIRGQFVPMVKTFKEANNDGYLQSILELKETHHVNCLLGFNEPDRASQGNTAVEDALRVWPKLMNTGMRLGSPAPSADDAGLKYLEQFMAGVDRQRLRVDFIAVHWYRDTSSASAPQQFLSFIEDMYRRYHRPIWITEFAGINWNPRDARITMQLNERFMRELLPQLERLDYVERYAWFSAPNEANLFADTRSWKLTALGETYRRIGGLPWRTRTMIDPSVHATFAPLGD